MKSNQAERAAKQTEEYAQGDPGSPAGETGAPGAARYRNMFQQAADPMFIHDMEGRFVDVNERACQVLGHTREELLAMSVYDVDPEAEAREDRKVIWQALARGSRTGLETFHKRKDGERFPVEISTSPVNEEGRQLVLAVARDVTGRKRLEKHMVQAGKTEAVGALAGGIAHHFNNALGAMLGYVELARSVASDNEEAREYLDGAIRACVRARDLVRQMLVFTRRNKAKRAPLFAHPVIRQSLDFFRTTLPAGVRMEYRVEKAPAVCSNPSEINQILMSLCSNAVEAMAGRGGDLWVEFTRGVVEPGSEEEDLGVKTGPCAILRVRDSGSGMDASVTDRIFDPFYTTGDPVRHPGLGLSLSSGIVNACGGCITVDSRPGRGSCFSVVLPAAGQALPDMDDTGPSWQEPPSGTAVLRVAREEADLCSARAHLVSHGLAVETSTDTGQAMDVFLRDPHRFDLVLVDPDMQQARGREIIRRIRGLRPDIGIVAWTRRPGSVDGNPVPEKDLDAYLGTPVDGDTLLETLGRVFHARKAARPS